MSKKKKSKKPESNLWAVQYEKNGHFGSVFLWVLAATADRATKKALSFLKKESSPAAFRITEVEWKGTIDVF